MFTYKQQSADRITTSRIRHRVHKVKRNVILSAPKIAHQFHSADISRDIILLNLSISKTQNRETDAHNAEINDTRDV